MDKAYKKALENQGYMFAGEHSAVKICGWTKKALTGRGTCYKQKFYGINCHRCVQMAPSVNVCQLDCVYCWRERHNSEFGELDEPDQIIDNCIEAQKKLLIGYKGNENSDKKLLDEAMKPMHFAISLTGEPCAYPKLSEFIDALHARNISTFLVTNGMMPDVLRKITLPTQLYISIDTSKEEVFEKINKPSFPGGWAKLMESLDFMRSVKDRARTVLRLTCVKGYNMDDAEGFAKIIERAEPKFVEVKAYMWVGASRERLTIENMPYHDEVKKYAEEICKHCDYKIIDEQEPSRVVLLMKDTKDQFLKF